MGYFNFTFITEFYTSIAISRGSHHNIPVLQAVTIYWNFDPVCYVLTEKWHDQTFPCFSNWEVWSIWWCNWMWLHISIHSPIQLTTRPRLWPFVAWESGRRYATVYQTTSNHITRSANLSQIFLCTLKNMGRPGYEVLPKQLSSLAMNVVKSH